MVQLFRLFDLRPSRSLRCRDLRLCCRRHRPLPFPCASGCGCFGLPSLNLRPACSLRSSDPGPSSSVQPPSAAATTVAHVQTSKRRQRGIESFQLSCNAVSFRPQNRSTAKSRLCPSSLLRAAIVAGHLRTLLRGQDLRLTRKDVALRYCSAEPFPLFAKTNTWSGAPPNKVTISMGVVYKAKDVTLHRFVILKLFICSNTQVRSATSPNRWLMSGISQESPHFGPRCR